MNRRETAKLVIAAALIAAPGTLFANGLRLVSQDGFASARGEAFVATADNPSAIYYNPAGITQIEGLSLRSGIYGIYLDPTFTPNKSAANAGTTYGIDQNVAAVPQTFATFSPKDSAFSF